MKTKHISIHLFLVTITVILFTSCTLFIDDDLVGRDLPKYQGNGYDAPVHEVGENYDVTYQYQPSTKVLTSEEEVKHVKYYTRDKYDYIHIVLFDKDTPESELPKVGQPIISTNMEKFPYGLFDIVEKCTKLKSGYAVISRHAQPREIFKVMELDTKLPVDFKDYDYLDEDSVMHHVHISDDGTTATIDGEEKSAMHRVKGVDIPIRIQGLYFPLTLSWNPKKNPNHPFQASLDGSLQTGLALNVHLSLFDGCNLSIEAGVWFDVEGEIQVHKATKPHRWKTFQKMFPFMAGPVPLFPKIGVSLYTQFEGKAFANLSYHYKNTIKLVGGEDEDGSGNGSVEENEMNFEAGFQGRAKLPQIKLVLGVGVGTPLTGVYANLSTSFVPSVSLTAGFKKDFTDDTSEEEYLSPAQFYDVVTDGDVHIDINPELKLSLETDWGFEIGVDGQSMEALESSADMLQDAIGKVQETIDDLEEDIKDYAEDADLDLDNNKQDVEDLFGEIIAEFEKDDQDQIMKELQLEADKIEDLKEMKEKDAKGLEENTKKLTKSFGPWKIYSLCFDIISKSIWPKMKDTSFRVGRKYNNNQTGLIFMPEYALEDPGLLSEWKTFYPGFVIKQGSTNLGFYPCDNGQVIDSDTERGDRFTATITGLQENVSYTCIPAYASIGNGKPTVFNKGISFSTVTPCVSIMDLEVTSVSVELEENSSVPKAYIGYFNTVSNVKGSRNIREWGIRDDKDTNEKTKFHKDKSATAGIEYGEQKGQENYMRSGYYTHHWKVKSKKGKVNISLTPYAIAKDDYVSGNTSGGPDYRKYFSTWEQKLNLLDYFQTNSSSSANDGTWDDDDFELELISSDFTPIDGEED